MVETSRAVVALVAVATVVAAVPTLAVAAPLAGGGAGSQVESANPTVDAGESAGDVQAAALAPGERLAGVVGVQHAELESEVATRALGRRLAAAATNGSRARILGAVVANLSDRLAALEAEKRDLERARENGTLNRGRYRAELARLHVRERALERLANHSERVAAGLPRETLEANGVNVTAIQRLRTDARNLTGPEVAAVARSIAGRGVGKGIGPPDDAGPPAFVENRSRGPGDGGPGDGGPGNGDGGPGNSDGGPPDDRGPPGEDDNETDTGDDSDDGDDGDGGPGNSGNNPGDGGQPDDRGPPDDRGDGNETGTGSGGDDGDDDDDDSDALVGVSGSAETSGR